MFLLQVCWVRTGLRSCAARFPPFLPLLHQKVLVLSCLFMRLFYYIVLHPNCYQSMLCVFFNKLCFVIVCLFYISIMAVCMERGEYLFCNVFGQQ